MDTPAPPTYLLGMAINPETTIKKIIYLPRTLWRRVEDFRFENRVQSEAETVRRLLERGLAFAEMQDVASALIVAIQTPNEANEFAAQFRALRERFFTARITRKSHLLPGEIETLDPEELER